MRASSSVTRKGRSPGPAGQSGPLRGGERRDRFLDEVGELTPGTQAKLLRVLEERVVTRVGSTQDPTDRRALLRRDESRHRGRQRDGGVPEGSLLPPERHLAVDPAVARAAAGDRAVRADVPRRRLPGGRAHDPACAVRPGLALLREHQWPGNVRELRNAIDRAVVSCLGDVILPEHLPPALLKAVESRRAASQVQAAPGATPAAPPVPPGGSGTLQSEIDAFEKARIIDTLERCGGNQSRAARVLGISRGTLIARLDAFAIARPRKSERPSEE